MYVKVVNGVSAADNTKSESSEESIKTPLEVLINPNCPIRIIYDYIQQTFKIDCESEFDLCDENGNLVFIYDKEPWINGTNFLAPKATYFVVFFDRDEDSRIFNPVLQIPDSYRKSSSQSNEMMTKIRKQLNLSFTAKGSRTSKTRTQSRTSLAK